MAFWNKTTIINFLEGETLGSSDDLHVKGLMIEHAIDLISKTIAKSELQVFKKKGKTVSKTIDETYYTLNIRPNPNEDGASFWKKVVSHMLRNGEALVVIENSNLYMASDWDVDDSFYFDKTYSNIELLDIELNSFKLNKSYKASDVLYLNMGDHKSIEIIESYYKCISKAIASSFSNYRRSNTKKYVLKQPTSTALIQDKDGKQIGFEEIVKRITENLMSEDDSVQPLPNNYSLDDISIEKSADSKDMLNNIKDFGDKVANAFGIPLDVFYGTKTDKSEGTDDFITLACLYPMQIVQDALNAKFIEKNNYIKGERIRFDKHTIKHFDIVNVASSLDKLFSIGWSVNDLKEILGEPIVNEDWADKHHVTKNYMDVEQEEGGE